MNAVNCALAMADKMVILNEKMGRDGQQALRMRIGLYTGPVVAGSLGSAERMKYTTIGDTVNTAARLESFDKDLVIPRLKDSTCRILIGEPTLRYVEGPFEVDKVGELSLKGKAQKIGAYCVLGRRSGSSDRAETTKVSQSA
jgi:adenylate cyclase